MKVKVLITALLTFSILSFVFVSVVVFFVIPNLTKGEVYFVPDVRGKSLDEAFQVLKTEGFSVDVTDGVYSEVEKGHVVSQWPPPNSKVKGKRVIKLTYSKGNLKIPVPDIVGLDVIEAFDILESFSLKLGNVEYEFSDEIPKNKVIRTYPLAGTLVYPNSFVDLIVSLGPIEQDN